MTFSPNIRRHFLGWERALLPQAVAWLAGDWRGDGPLDLSATLVIVPTRQSGRRLREALAGFAATRGRAAFPPVVRTPDALVTEGLTAPGVASRLDSLLAWTEVFRAIPLDEFREVFPLEPPGRNFNWALRLAQQFARLQATLAEGGLRLADVAPAVGAEFPEAQRWQQLGELEKRHAAQLAARGLRDGQAEKITAAFAPPKPSGITRIVVLATPDPMPLALAALEAHARTLPVDIVIFGFELEAGGFDGWGRPDPRHWSPRELELPEFARRVHLCLDPGAQAARVVAAVQAYAHPEGAIALGVADPEVLPLVEGALERAGGAVFNPEGRARRGEAFFNLLAALAELAREPGWEAVATLARCPDLLSHLQATQGGGFSAAHFLKGLDDLRARHLVADLDAALAFGAERLPGLRVIAELRTMLLAAPFPEAAAAVLARLFAGRRIDGAREDDARFEEAANAWTRLLRECEAARARFPNLDAAEWWELALRLFGEETRTEEKPAGALELQGWLELLFEDAPHLAVAGVNDAFVPEAVTADAFLPESLRARLGLKTNAARFARDAYLLQAIATCRPRLDLLLGKVSSVGEPLRPSRLLLRCSDAELPERVAFLFREPEAARPGLPWSRAWQLAPRPARPPESVSVTALRMWLKCPFRFYLRHVLKMEPVDPAKDELDARDFGILLHTALEALGREETLRDCADPAVLRVFLLAELERQTRARFGADLTLPLIIQIESARQRLGKAAEVEAAERAAGWRTLAVERPFTIEVAGLAVRGKIDRIDRHAVTGAVRVLDYKTSDRAVNPADVHLKSAPRDEAPPAWQLGPEDGKPRVWSDLQLPLYELALAAEFGGGVTCGYFNLPKAVGETNIALWEGFTPELRASARGVAEHVCAGIRAGEFWPPRELKGSAAEWDEFAPLFQRGVEASVAWPGARTA